MKNKKDNPFINQIIVLKYDKSIKDAKLLFRITRNDKKQISMKKNNLK